MGILELILLGVGLAMDCFAVSLAKGMAAGKLRLWPAIVMALFFGIFQAGMPMIGYFAGLYFASLIAEIAPWVAFVLLGFIGGKMLKEHFCPEEEEADNDYTIRTILILAVATSIDALATGLIFVGQSEVLPLAISIIGICSFLFSMAGTLIGVFAGSRFKFPANLVGGLILIGIGLKIWIQGLLL